MSIEQAFKIVLGLCKYPCCVDALTRLKEKAVKDWKVLFATLELIHESCNTEEEIRGFFVVREYARISLKSDR